MSNILGADSILVEMDANEITLPKFSTSEERVFKQCRLAHHFEYDLGFRRVIPNRKLQLGIIVHTGLDAYYTGDDPLEAVEVEAEKHWQAIRTADPSGDGYAESLTAFASDKELALAMVGGYVEWVEETGIDANWETISVEESHLIEIPDVEALIPVRMDLVQRNRQTGRLRVVDHKTCRSIPTDLTPYQLAEQNANYQLACLAIYGERPTEMAYTFLRKIVPSARSKPPYFARHSIVLTADELRYRIAELRTIVAERFDPDRSIYATPDNCCGSWKNDWRRPCMLVHAGVPPQEALEASPGYELSDAYARYADLEEDNDE